jgi:hypothetical protein
MDRWKGINQGGTRPAGHQIQSINKFDLNISNSYVSEGKKFQKKKKRKERK